MRFEVAVVNGENCDRKRSLTKHDNNRDVTFTRFACWFPNKFLKSLSVGTVEKEFDVSLVNCNTKSC